MNEYEFLTVLLAAISSVATLWTIYLTIFGNRPYIGFEGFNIGYFSKNLGPISCFITLTNVGVRPLKNLETKIQIIDKNFIPKFSSQIVTPTEIAKGISIYPTFETPWNSKNKNLSEHYMIVEVHYSDVILRKNYYQYTIMKWKGMVDSVTKEFNHVSVTEALSLKKFLKN